MNTYLILLWLLAIVVNGTGCVIRYRQKDKTGFKIFLTYLVISFSPLGVVLVVMQIFVCTVARLQELVSKTFHYLTRNFDN